MDENCLGPAPYRHEIAPAAAGKLAPEPVQPLFIEVRKRNNDANQHEKDGDLGVHRSPF